MSFERYPIVVIGAGPAGSVASTLLARAGFCVILIEQHRFPRDKVCGECVSSLGIEVLRRVGALDRIRNLGAIELSHGLIHSPAGESLAVGLPFAMWGISRGRMDAALLDVARESGVTIRQPARCESLRSLSPDHAIATVRDLTTNSITLNDAAMVIVADGKPARSTSSDMGIKAHFTNVAGPRNAIELFGVTGSYGGLAPIEDDQWNASFSMPLERIRATPEIDQLFGQIVSENVTLSKRLRLATRVSKWMVSPLPRAGIMRDWQPGVIPIGNAAASIEPIGGEGMGLALRSAELAANAVIVGSVNVAVLRKSYRELWDGRARACRLAAMIVSRPTLCDAVIGSVTGADALVRSFTSAIGKSPV